jgi:spore germination protein YaaH
VPESTPTPTPRPVPGHEVYGYLPYWEMDDGIAAHLQKTSLTTLALFSVTTNTKGAVNTKQTGYRRITGPVGRRVIREAHERGVRVELVFSSFGLARNERFLESMKRQDATIASLVELVGELRLDGVNVDIELLDAALVPAYGAFVGRLRDAVVAADASDRVTVATMANVAGAAMATAAAGAGADRIFLMGYDYHWAGSDPGASAPLDRRDGDERDLAWSLDLYEVVGVPVERTILGLPLYGMTWPVTDPELGAPRTGRGEAWIPRRNLDVLRDPSIVPVRDDIEVVEFYAFASDGSTPQRWSPPSRSPGAMAPSTTAPGVSAPVATPPAASPPAASPPAATPDDRTWRAVYVDSPATLTPKLSLANDRGLAGVGFWAIGYERGLPAYTDLIARFAAGNPLE